MNIILSYLRIRFEKFHISRRNCLIHDVIEGQMMEVKGVGRRRTQFLDNLRTGEAPSSHLYVQELIH